MNITVQIMLGVDEYASDLAGNATEIAEKILRAVGGDPEKDMVSVNIQDTGSAGMTMTMGPPPPVQAVEEPEPPVEEAPPTRP